MINPISVWDLLYLQGIDLITSTLKSAPDVRVHGEFVQVVVLVEGIVFPQVDELLQGLVDEDDADEWGEGFLREACDVTNQGAGVRGHQHDAEERRPQADACSQGQIG